jgi:alkylation response protein AidB-like acyl-CoA dehydrogenase
MANYLPPTRDMRFILDHVVDFAALTELEVFAEATPDVVGAVIEEAGRLAAEVVAPLNVVGDQQGSVLENGVVRTPQGFREAYTAFAEGGWSSLAFDPAYGGQGLPVTLAVIVGEMLNSANMAFGLCPMLTGGAVEALAAHGSPEIKERYLEKLISGEWTGTMNLTEPQAGSDVGATRTRAEAVGGGVYHITGQKIFITYGDHDFTDNIIHLVLARLPGAPDGTRGISLFVVPKFLVNDDGSLGVRNDVRVVSLEHKLGIHASPTCVMAFGDEGACTGYLVGEENKGMRAMFTMMNNARLNVGVQGVAVAERAWQAALDYARERRQGRAIGRAEPGTSPIIDHADVRRMLMTMKANIEAARALAYWNAVALDFSHHHPDAGERARYERLAGLLTPLTKAWGSDLGVEIASLAVQVHGGMGFIEETGVAQFYRDARIAPIYEGTNGIQALDLVMRKLSLDGGEGLRALLGDITGFAAGLPDKGALGAIRRSLAAAAEATGAVSQWLGERLAGDLPAAAAGATPYLRMLATTVGGFLLAKGAMAASALRGEDGADKAFLDARVVTARFFAEQILSQVPALAAQVTAGEKTLFALDPEQLAG